MPRFGARRYPPGRAQASAAAARVVDGLLELSVAGSFSRVGCLVRRRIEGWREPPRLDGKVFIVTGASSGIGKATAVALVRLGAEVWLTGRDATRTAAAVDVARHAATGARVESVLLDLVDAGAVGDFAARFASSHDRLDGLIHNAGALYRQYQTAPDGSELTVATHVLAPFRLAWHLSPLLFRPGASVIVTVASGGMYAERFDLDQLEMPADGYKGVRAYARAKRAQVVLAHEWARRWGTNGVASYGTHPGWVDTPGLAAGLPSFTRLGRLLRSPEEGADTVVWLVAGGPREEFVVKGAPPAVAGEGFWHDRRHRSEYRLPGTRPRRGERARQGAELWAWCAGRTGVGGGSGRRD